MVIRMNFSCDLFISVELAVMSLILSPFHFLFSGMEILEEMDTQEEAMGTVTVTDTTALE